MNLSAPASRGRSGLAELEVGGDVVGQRVGVDPDLLHGVAVPDGDHALQFLVLPLADGVEVHRDAQRGAHLVVPAVALADVAGVLVVDAADAELEQHILYLFGLLHDLRLVAGERDDGYLDRGEVRLKL